MPPPPLWATALALWPLHPPSHPHPSSLPRPWIAAATTAAATSLLLLLRGQPADHILHGWPRLLGLYGNLHGHAAAMAAFATTAIPASLSTLTSTPAHAPRPPGPNRPSPDTIAAGILGTAALIAAGATWVRGAWVWIAIGLAVALAVRRRAQFVVLATATAAAAVIGVGVLRDRFSDLIAVITLTPPPQGWGSLGSWRVRIWLDVLQRFAEGTPADWVFGRGLGDHLGLHRHLEPHSDALSVLVQAGIAGAVAHASFAMVVAVALGRRARSDPVALAGLAGLAGALGVALVSNDFVFRPTPTMWIYGIAALAISRPPARGSAAPAAPPGA